MVETEQEPLKFCNGVNKNETWSISKSSNNSEPLRVIRKVINPAIYVESTINNMAPFKRSPLYLNETRNDVMPVKVIKRCVCLTDANNCPCHPIKNTNNNHDKQLVRQLTFKNYTTSISPQHSLKSESDSGLKAGDRSDLNLSIISISSSKNNDEMSEANRNFKHWLSKKLQEKKEREIEIAKIKELQELEKQRNLENERENFKRWLMQKKKDEEKRRKEKEQKLEKEKMKQEIKEKRSLENDLKYQLWLKKKEEAYLSKKLKEQMALLKTSDEKQKRLEESSKAYEMWLKNSKNKQKPLPFNQGIDSLRSSVSVTFVNPTPWIPNIETKPKPASQ